MATVVHHRFSLEDYHRMIASGIIGEDDPVELIRGEIVSKMPVGQLHVAVVNRLTQLWVNQLMGAAIVSVQNPIVLPDSEPEPDIAILDPRVDYYASAKPTSVSVRVLIEVADTSLEYDREIKLPLYAQGAIADFWIVNLSNSVVEVYRQPNGSAYDRIVHFKRGELISPQAFPKIVLPVDAILG